MYQNQGGYPQGGYPPPGGAYPPQGGAYPPQAGYPPQPGYAQGYGPPPPPTYQPGYGEPGFAPSSTLGEDGDVKGFDFSEQTIRKAFIRKVYAILSCQLLVTLAFIALFLFHEPTKLYVRQRPAFFIVALIVTFVCLISMACCTNVRRQSPMNFIFLSIFTLAEAFLLGVSSSTYDVDAVFMAVGITAAVCFGLTLFAFQSKYDFTAMGGVLVCAVVILLIFGIVTIFIPHNKIVTLVYASLGALIFSLYIVYDTQLMMGGKHKYSLSPEEYIFASLNLYLDIINLFMFILTIIGASRE